MQVVQTNGLGSHIFSPGNPRLRASGGFVNTTDTNAAAKRKIFGNVLKAGLIFAICCLVMFFWCTARYTSSAHTNRFTKIAQIKGAAEYYDWNRDRSERNGFTAIKSVKSTKSCNTAGSTAWKEDQLFYWPGSKAGYLDSTVAASPVYKVGKVPTPKPTTFSKQITATAAQPFTGTATRLDAQANIWKGNKFCVQTYQSATTKFVVSKKGTAGGFFALLRKPKSSAKCVNFGKINTNFKSDWQSALQCTSCDCVVFVADQSTTVAAKRFSIAPKTAASANANEFPAFKHAYDKYRYCPIGAFAYSTVVKTAGATKTVTSAPAGADHGGLILDKKVKQGLVSYSLVDTRCHSAGMGFTQAAMKKGSAEIKWCDTTNKGAACAKVPHNAFCAQTQFSATQQNDLFNSNTFLVDLEVTFGAATAKARSPVFPCRDWNADNKPNGANSKSAWPLINQDFTTGCGVYGNDKENSMFADEQDDDSWLAENKARLEVAMGKGTGGSSYPGEWNSLKTVFQTANIANTLQNKFVLNGRTRITVSCSATCNKFEAYSMTGQVTLLQKELTVIWGVLKTTVWTIGVLSMVSIILVVRAAIAAKNDSAFLTQQNLLHTYGFVMCTCFIACVFAWYLCFAVKNDFNDTRAEFAAWAACIVNPANVGNAATDKPSGWAGVLTTLHKDASLNNFHNWMIWWVVFTTINVLCGLSTLMKGLSALGKLQGGFTPVRPTWSNAGPGVRVVSPGLAPRFIGSGPIIRGTGFGGVVHPLSPALAGRTGPIVGGNVNYQALPNQSNASYVLNG